MRRDLPTLNWFCLYPENTRSGGGGGGRPLSNRWHTRGRGVEEADGRYRTGGIPCWATYFYAAESGSIPTEPTLTLTLMDDRLPIEVALVKF